MQTFLQRGLPETKLPVPPPNWNSSRKYTTGESARSLGSQTTRLARPWEDTRRKLDAGPKQKFFRKPSKSLTPEPANETKPGDGTRKPMEMEPESECLAKRTYGRKPIPEPTNQTKLWSGTRKPVESEPESKLLAKRTNGSQSRVPIPNRNFNKGRM